MTRPALRLAVFGLFVFGFVLLSGREFVREVTPALAQATETFTATAPLKVYSEVPSHAGVVDADPTLGTNGYCVTVAGEDHTSVTGAPTFGFSAVNGVVLSAAFFNNGSATTTDDTYCVIVAATRITAELPRPDMIVQWTYLEGGLPVTIELPIAVVTVVIEGSNSTAGIPARVCTVGWDPLFLTGEFSNSPPTFPQALDEVVPSDWDTTPDLTPGIIGVLRGDNPEWCVNIVSDTPVSDIDVDLTFWAMYNTQLETDDVLITEDPRVNEVIDIGPGDRPEIRHITTLRPDGSGGAVESRRAANPNVVGAPHTACVFPSVEEDTLDPNQIQFISPNGALPTGLTVFTNDGAIVPGAPAGTKCFRWTSLSAGYQEVYATFTMDPLNPLNGTAGDITTFISWDTNLDGNGDLGPGSGLLKYWNVIDYTVINTGGDPFDQTNHLTNGTINLPMAFNVASGTFLANVDLTEWVIGTRPGPAGSDGEPIDGVPVRLEILSDCGYFGDGPAGPKVIDDVTLDGRVELSINIFADPSCGQGSQISLRVTASYPAAISNPPLIDVETLLINLTFTASESSPTVAWAGTTITLGYGFGGSDCDEQDVLWAVEDGTGAFIGGNGSTMTTRLIGCETAVQFESESPGEVSIVAQLRGNSFSKTVFPIFFIAFEDLELSVGNADPIVSEIGSVNATVRGWFVGSNPSGRPAEKKADGRQLPRDRWVLPDDWAIMRGPEGFRPGWPASASLPPAPVTFYMENEGRTNSFKGGVKDGAAGHFVIEGGTFAHNISPTTGVPSKLGSLSDADIVSTVLLQKPRIISKNTDNGGSVSVSTFGDLNLSFEECAVNAPTGNPHCEPGDVVGRTTFYAIVDYPELRHRGKMPPIRSNNDAAAFHWAGYKRVTWEAGTAPSIRYVVAHLKDRDGFCDAAHFNNTLGVLVEFEIDSADGIMTEAADRPFVINNDGTRKFAVVTTFDTVNDLGVPMNAAITKVVQEDGECQAWIRIDNSLGEPVNVHVTFSPPPPPIPGDIRITALVCGQGGSVEITNVGTNEVSLAGFALRSANRVNSAGFIDEEHLGLEGHVMPGERILIPGEALLAPWVGGSDAPLAGEDDYVRIVWEEQTIDYRECDGTTVHPDSPKLPADGEGAIEIDLIVPFNTRDAVQMSRGWNLVAIVGGTIPLDEALGGNVDAVDAIYSYDEATDTWLKYIPGLPGQSATITELEGGRAYWVLANRPFTLVVPR